MTRLTEYDPWDINIGQFIYHATPDGFVFDQNCDADTDILDGIDTDRIRKIDLWHSNPPTDFGTGFYLGDDIEMSKMW